MWIESKPKAKMTRGRKWFENNGPQFSRHYRCALYKIISSACVVEASSNETDEIAIYLSKIILLTRHEWLFTYKDIVSFILESERAFI